MARMSYLSAIERYEEYQGLIQNLLLSILASVHTALAQKKMFNPSLSSIPF